MVELRTKNSCPIKSDLIRNRKKELESNLTESDLFRGRSKNSNPNECDLIQGYEETKDLLDY